VGLGGAAVVDLDVGLAVGDALHVAAAGTRRRGWRGWWMGRRCLARVRIR
jgi:hypothetical protein